MAFLKIFSTEWLTELNSLFKTTHYIRAAGNAGENIPNGTTNVPFISITDTGGIFNGSQITMPFDGILEISFAVRTAGGGNWYPAICIDGSNEAGIGQYATTATNKGGEYKRKLSQGQVVSIRLVNITGVLTNNPTDHWLTATVIRG